MAAADAKQSPPRPLHVVVFPWLAFGHMIPFLELSKRLARRGHAVTFVSTPRNAARLGAVPPELSARHRVVTLELPEVEGLPAGAESTADVPPEKVALLKKALDGLAAPFAALVATLKRKPDWIVLDFAHNWVCPIAEEYKVRYTMRAIGASCLSNKQLKNLKVVGMGHFTTEWLRILFHPTHCGWGSTLEGLFRSGLPLVMLPFVLDQGLNARAAAARGIGVEVARNDGGDGWFGREEVAAAVRRVTVEEEGEGIARNAREIQMVVGEDRVRQEGYVDELVEHLQAMQMIGW